MSKKIKVTFLTFYHEAWDSLAEIHRLMLADPRFEVEVVALGRRLTGDKDFTDGSETSKYFTEHGIAHRVADQTRNDLAESFGGGPGVDAAAGAPDYIFVNYPWQRNYPAPYRPDALARIARIAYVPYYSLPLTNEPADGSAVATHLYTQRMHQLASLVFVQDVFVRDAYAGTARGNQHVHHVGSTKLDALLAEMHGDVSHGDVLHAGTTHPSTEKPFTILWAPHHSYSPHWLNFGTFAQNHIAVLAWARDHAEVQVVLRPHPFLFGTLIDRAIMTRTELAEWLDAWNELPNTSIDDHSSSAELFAESDLLLTDGISYLAEYPLATGHPAVFIENAGHWQFSPLGELAAASAVRINSFEDFVSGYEYLREAGVPDRSSEINALREAASPYPGEVASRIVEIVAADYAAAARDETSPNGLALVDPAPVTETAWEMQPGREPLD